MFWDASANAYKPNPFRKSAVFVVHGMGARLYLETAVTLREGFENVIDEFGAKGNSERVPPPFVFEGYWANHGDPEQTFPDEWATFNASEKDFFTRLWQRRSQGTVRTFFWFLRQTFRLVTDKDVRKKVGWFRWVTYWGLVILSVVSFLLILVRHPRILANVLSDVRLYLAPNGEIEKAIVQRIDLKVGEQFLLLLGLNWDFQSLRNGKKLKISGDDHTFDRVIWVAHSLGSVVSYNVISDLLRRCNELRLAPGSSVQQLPREQQEIQENIRRVESGLRRFITLGSPLQKVRVLFPGVLRRWPDNYLDLIPNWGNRWWINVLHVWDPVSGILRDPQFFRPAINAHSSLWRLPGWAHVSYWTDRDILKLIISRTYGKSLFQIDSSKIDFLSGEKIDRYRDWTLLSGVFFLAVIVVAVVYLSLHNSPPILPGLEYLIRAFHLG